MPAIAKSVLVVDDDPEVREAVVEAIQSTGRVVYEANSGRDALEVLGNIPFPCFILLDLTMPGLTGIETLEGLRQHPQFDQITVVVMSASTRKAIDYAGRLPGVIMTLAKPFALAELDRILDQHCIPGESMTH